MKTGRSTLFIDIILGRYAKQLLLTFTIQTPVCHEIYCKYYTDEGLPGLQAGHLNGFYLLLDIPVVISAGFWGFSPSNPVGDPKVFLTVFHLVLNVF